MNQRSISKSLQNQADRRTCMTVIGFVYSPLALLLGTAAVISSG